MQLSRPCWASALRLEIKGRLRQLRCAIDGRGSGLCLGAMSKAQGLGSKAQTSVAS